jgi:hypothetical protein
MGTIGSTVSWSPTRDTLTKDRAQDNSRINHSYEPWSLRKWFGWVSKQRLVNAGVKAALSVLLVCVSLRGFLFVPGYYLYADQFWSINPSFGNSDTLVPLLFTGSGRVSAYPLPQFTRDIISWPSVVFQAVSPNYEAYTRVFFAYTFLIFVLLCWAFAGLLCRTIQRVAGWKLDRSSRWMVEGFVVLAAYANFLTIDYNADGGTVSDSLILIGLAVALLISATRSDLRGALALGLILCLILLLDPDYYIIGIFGIVVCAGLAGVVEGSLLRRGRMVGTGILLSIPVLAFVFEGLVLVGAPGSLSSTRAIAQGHALARNLSAWSAISLYGFSWSTVTLAPPSLALGGAAPSTLPGWGSPTILVLPPGALTTIWLLTASFLPLMAIAALLLPRKVSSLTLPIAGATLAGLLFSFYTSSTTLYQLLTSAATIPLVGPAIGTTFAVPDHMMILGAAGYLVLAPATLHFLLSRLSHPTVAASADEQLIPFTALGAIERRYAGFRPRTHTMISAAVAFVAIAIVVLAGWQSLNGTFYPARADNSTFAGNGVPSIGAFSPFPVSAPVLETYSYLVDQGGGFNIYWPVGYGIGFDRFRPFEPGVDLTDLRGLIAFDLPQDLWPYLVAHSVRYIVVQNQTGPEQFYTPIAIPAVYHDNPYLYYFGLQNYSQVVAFLAATPGLRLAFTVTGISVFEVEGSPQLEYSASILLNTPVTAAMEPETYGLFQSIGHGVALVDTGGYGVDVTYGGPGPGVAVLTPENLSSGYLDNPGLTNATLPISLLSPSEGTRYVANSSSLPSRTPWYQNHTLGMFNENVSGYYFSNWAGNYTAEISKGTISIFSATGATFTLDYGGPATYASTGLSVRGTALPIEANLAASLTMSAPTESKVTATFIAVNQTTNSTLAEVVSQPAPSDGAYLLSTSQTIPNGTEYFAYRLGGYIQGYLNISYYTVALGVLPLNSSGLGPFGNALDLSNTSFGIANPGEVVNVLAVGRGTINGVPANSSTPTFSALGMVGSLAISGSVAILGVVLSHNESLFKMEGFYLVYNGAEASSVLAEMDGNVFSPITSNYGTNLYILPGPGNYSMVAPALEDLQAAYPFVVGYIVLVGVFISDPARKSAASLLRTLWRNSKRRR